MTHLKKTLALFLSLVMLFTVFGGSYSASAAVKKAPKQELNILLGPDPTNLDPGYYGGALTSGCEGGHILNNTYEGLMREVNRKLIPGCAEKYTVSEDGCTYTFYLKDSKWSDGKPVTAKDFEYAWKRVLDPKTAADYAYLLYGIKGALDFNEGSADASTVGIKALDDRTLQVTLAAPNSIFPLYTTLHCFMPVRQDMVEKDPQNWSKNPKTAVSNGPFVLTAYTAGKSMVLSKNASYWNAKAVKLTKITAMISEDEAAAVASYKKNKLDIVDIYGHQDVPALKKIPTFKLLPEHMSYYYVFNTQKAPMNDVRVRQALSMAIDRVKLINEVAKPGLFPAGGIVPVGFRDSQNNEFRKIATEYKLIGNPDTLEKAKKLLADAGFPDGKGFPAIDITTSNTIPEHETLAKAIQTMWKENLGITATIKTMDSKTFQATLKKGDFTIARQGWGADYGDPMTFLDLWTSQNAKTNGSFWSNKDYDTLIEGANKATGKERDTMLYSAEKMLMDDMVLAPIYYLTDPVLVQNYVRGWDKGTSAYWWFGNTYIVKK